MKNDIDQYCIQHSTNESLALKEIREYTLKNEQAPAMISGLLVTNTLKNIIQISGVKNVLEIGMFTGYSALKMAAAIPKNGEIHTCEIMDRHINTAKSFFNKSTYKDKIFIHAGDALKTLENFKIDSFDFAFIDADKISYIEYYKKCMQIVKSNGVIVLDNMLWGGSVISPKDKQSKVLKELAEIINNDSRNTNIMLPVRDGLMICYKK